MNFTEEQLELSYLEILEDMGWEHIDGRQMEREDLHKVILEDTLREAVYRINLEMPNDSKEEAIKKVLHLSDPAPVKANEAFHKMLVEGVDVGQYVDNKKQKRSGGKVYLLDFQDSENNIFQAINQFTIIGVDKRRPDIILFINGIPLIVIELKSMINENVDIKNAFQQIEWYKLNIPDLFKYNAFIIISDGLNAKVGTISSNAERFMSFRSVDGVTLADSNAFMMEVLARGTSGKERILEIIKDFILFMDTDKDKVKILAQYHQLFAVKKAIEKTAIAQGNEGKIGVVWHTQGSGKSLTMVFYAGQLMKKFNNPTIIILTDRNDLDNQLFGTFSNCQSYLVETPKQANDKDELKNLLNVNSGGIIFTTIQKFTPKAGETKQNIISSRDDIYIIADEAHRSQYGLDEKMDQYGNSKYGYAQYIRDALPNANYIGFTGTPIDFDDKSTVAVFGDYIDTYDMSHAVEDGTTVKIYYENRFIKLDIDYNKIYDLDEDLCQIMEDQSEEMIEKKKKELTKMEILIGSENRIKSLAKDFVEHWETRKNNAFGKCMIVCLSREICVKLYNEIVNIRPDWHNDDKTKGKIKIIMTTDISRDPKEYKVHSTTKQEREDIAKRMKNIDDEFEIAIVRDMWLTGFDVPCMHTMYIDKPMVGHNLMQAIARVNRVYKDKSGGLIVDYIGIGESLKKALKQYSPNDQKTAGIDTSKAVAVMLEHYEIIKEILHDFDYSKYKSKSPSERARAIIEGMDYILKLDSEKDGIKKNFLDNVIAISKAHALCITTKEGQKYNSEISYFKAIKANLVRKSFESKDSRALTEDQVNEKLAKLMSETIISEDVIDIYSELGMKIPDISILSDEFLGQLEKMKYKNLAIEMLKRLLEGKIRYIDKKNITMSEKFSERLLNIMNQYKNKAITSIEIMEELIRMAKDMTMEENSGKELGLTNDEKSFYDALSKDEKVKRLMGDEKLIKVVKELTDTIKKNVTIDWYNKESARAQIRKLVRRLLKKYGYPPKEAEDATEVVLKQAELFGDEIIK